MGAQEITLGKYNNSMNFIFGLTRGDVKSGEVDILNNPYVRFLGLERHDGKNFTEKYDIELCSTDFKRQFMPERNIDIYSQALCFKDRDSVRLQGSWLNADFAFPVVGLAYCRNTIENGDWCKSKEETDEWLLSHPTFFVHQDTQVQKQIWKDHPAVQGHPYYGDISNYLPTVKQMISYNFGKIDYEPGGTEIVEDEVYFGKHFIKITDSNWDII